MRGRLAMIWGRGDDDHLKIVEAGDQRESRRKDTGELTELMFRFGVGEGSAS